MTKFFYTYNIQIRQKKAAVFLINIDTFLYNWVLQSESRPTSLI